MTTVNCDVRDSLGQPVTGFIRVTLEYLLGDPDTSYLPVPAKVDLVGGLAVLELEPSEAAGISYLFEVVRVYERMVDDEPVSTEEVVWTFRATVPDSDDPIELVELAQQTGVTRDTLDGYLSAIVRKLYTSDAFWARARDNLIPYRGEYDPLAWYQQGVVVTYDGSSWLCRSALAITGIQPGPGVPEWGLVAARGLTGTGTAGNDTAYSPTGWNGQTDAPSRNSVRDIIETLATKTEVNSKVSAAGAQLTGAAVSDTLPLSDSSSRLAYTSWVQANLTAVDNRSVPVGALMAWLTASAPARWLLLDGRLVSRTTYSALFSLWGTTFGVGDGSTTFALPDMRGRTLFGTDASPVNGAAGRNTRLTGIGSTVGQDLVTLTTAQMPAHTHGLTDPGHAHGTNAVNVVGSGGPILANISGGGSATLFAGGNNGATASGSTGISMGSQGGGASHENMPPSLAGYWIAFAGV